MKTTCTLHCDFCGERIATGAHVKEAYEMAAAVGSIPKPNGGIFCLNCEPQR